VVEYFQRIVSLPVRVACWVRDNPRFSSTVVGTAFAIGLVFTYAMLSGSKCTSTSGNISIQGWGDAHFGMTDDELERVFGSVSRVVPRMEFFQDLYVIRTIPHYDAFGYPFVVKFQLSGKTGKLDRVLLTYGADVDGTAQLNAGVSVEYNRMLHELTQLYGQPDLCFAESKILQAVITNIDRVVSFLDKIAITAGRPGSIHRDSTQWTLQNAIIDLGVSVQFGRLSQVHRISLGYRHFDASIRRDAK
jgi:hypothetical protein